MFFDWLDSGRGALIDLPSCPRRLLEERKVLYLSREELKLCEVRRLARACLASCHALRVGSASRAATPLGSASLAATPLGPACCARAAAA